MHLSSSVCQSSHQLAEIKMRHFHTCSFGFTKLGWMIIFVNRTQTVHLDIVSFIVFAFLYILQLPHHYIFFILKELVAHIFGSRSIPTRSCCVGCFRYHGIHPNQLGAKLFSSNISYGSLHSGTPFAAGEITLAQSN